MPKRQKSRKYKQLLRRASFSRGEPSELIDRKKLLDVSGTGITLLTSDMRILWTNKFMQETYGPLKNLIGKHCFKALHSRKSLCPECKTFSAAKKKSISSGYVRRKLPDGSLRIYQVLGIPLLNPERKVDRILEIAIDVTKSRKLELELKKSEEFYRTLFEYSGTAIAINNKKGIITSVNKTFCDLAGYKREEIEGKKHYLEFVFDKERVEKIHKKRWGKSPSAPTEYEYIFLAKNGDKRLIDITINRIPGTEFSMASMIDNTEKKELERQSREKEEFLANILNESADAIVFMDHQRIIKTWNKGAELIFGYKPGQIINKRFDILVPQDLLLQGELDRLRKKVLEDGYVRNYITERIRKDKRRVTVAETATLIKDENDKPIGRSIILRDITERIRLEKQLAQTEKMMTIGTLSAGLAHEIKNPLNSIVINIEIIKNHLNRRDGTEEKPYEKYLSVIEREIARLDNVIKNFLNFTKPHGMRFKTVDMNNIVNSVVELLDPEAKNANIALIKKLSANIDKIHGEEGQLVQILINLVLNSIQAIQFGGAITIETSNQRGGRVLLTVTDTGRGIKPEDRPRIFDLFFTTKEKGDGIGLPTVAQLIKNHSGTIDFQSTVGKGTKFFITFPAI